jgi:hypothetical protein
MFKKILTVLFIVVLTSCGGGSPVSAVNTGAVAPFSLSVAALAGNWVRGLCITASSVRGVQRVTVLSVDTIQFSQDYIQYSGPNCTGAGVLMNAPSNLGTIKFINPEYSSNAGFFRGDWTLPSTQVEKIIWAFKRANLYCAFSDTTPTSFANPQDVENYLNIIANDFCFEKM